MAARNAPINNSSGNLDPFKVPWFADCAPSLLTNRTIRRYLNAYSQHTWPEVRCCVVVSPHARTTNTLDTTSTVDVAYLSHINRSSS